MRYALVRSVSAYTPSKSDIYRYDKSLGVSALEMIDRSESAGFLPQTRIAWGKMIEIPHVYRQEIS